MQPKRALKWTRKEFATWSKQNAKEHGYGVRFEGIGPETEGVGTPTQMAVFTLDSQSGG